MIDVKDSSISSEIVRDLQKTQYYILKLFDKFCKRFSIPYTLDFGTLLGAVRHGGFIPWDDDIDVSMLRSDYENFLKCSKNGIDKDLFIQHYMDDSQFVHSFTRIRLNETLAIQSEWQNLDVHHGIFIDLFVYDVMPNEESKCQLHADIIRKIQEEKMYYVENNLANNINLRTLNTLQTRVITTYNKNINDNSYVAHMTQGLDSYYSSRRKVSDFYETKMLQFKTDLFPAPINYDHILENIYGEYMSPPPKTEQTPHHGVIKIMFREDVLDSFDS